MNIRQHQIKRMGWMPDLPDRRDFLFSARPHVLLPSRVDLRPHCSPVQDQLDLGACTAFAIVGALEYLQRVRHRPSRQLSKQFLYYQERVIERTVKQDAGAQIRDGIKACAKIGVSMESLCRYDTATFTRKPRAAAYVDAAKRTITAYKRIQTLHGVRTALAAGTPVVFGFSVYDSFESEDVALHGVVPMPKKNEPMIGGHAVLAVGYDDEKRMVLCRNSWSESWGIKGYFWLPYAYIMDRDLSDDFWAITE